MPGRPVKLNRPEGATGAEASSGATVDVEYSAGEKRDELSRRATAIHQSSRCPETEKRNEMAETDPETHGADGS